MGEQGLYLERTSVGDRYVMARMREGGFNIGGEQSGHVILSDFSTTGDGLIAALQVLAVMIETGKPMSALGRQFEPVPQLLENVRFAGGKPLEHKSVKEAIADGESQPERLGPRRGAPVRHRAPDPHHGRGRRRGPGRPGDQGYRRQGPRSHGLLPQKR